MARVVPAEFFAEQFAKDPANARCADTGAQMPEWASVSHGTYISIEASGVHRGLGVRVSRVRSIRIDSWDDPVQLRQMELGGNRRFRDFLRQHGVPDDLPIAEKYSTRAADWYRKSLRARAEGLQPPAALPQGTGALPCSTDLAHSSSVSSTTSPAALFSPSPAPRAPTTSSTNPPQAAKKRAGTGLVLLLVGMQVVTYTAQSILTKMTVAKGVHEGFKYDANSAVLLTELMKGLISLFSVVSSGDQSLLKLHAMDPLTFFRRTLRYAFPAVLYVVHNFLIYVAHIYLSAPTYQLLNNIKIITTGMVYRVVLQRKLLTIQWLALLQLMLGMACTSLESDCSKPVDALPGDFDPLDQASAWYKGLSIMVVIAICSSLAGVYSEVVVKSAGLPVQVGNVWQCTYGVLTSAIAYQWTHIPGQGFLDGYTPAVWGVVFANGILGLVISFIFKYGDNIIKLFGASSAVLFTAALSSVLFDYKPGASLWLGYLLVGCSLFLYYGGQETLFSYDSDSMSWPKPRQFCRLRRRNFGAIKEV